MDPKPFVSRRHLISAAGLALPLAAQNETQPVRTPPQQAETEQQGGPPPAPLPPAKRVGFALVGLGKLSIEELLPAFGNCRKARVSAFVTGSPDKARVLARQYGVSEQSIYTYEQFDRLKENADVQVAYIVTPNSLHREHTVRAIQAGKHVLCEKPMATSVRDCEEMVAAAARAKRKLMIAYRMQYEPYNRTVRDLVRKQQYGPVRLIDAVNVQRNGNPDQWRLKKQMSGLGALSDLGIYCINTIRYVLGEEPVEVLGMVRNNSQDPRFREVAEAYTWQMRFPSGVMATMMTGYDEHESQRYQIYLPTGWMELDPAFAYRGLELRTSRADGRVEREERPRVREHNQFALEMDHFADCVLRDRRPFTPGEEGLQDYRIMEAIEQSARTGRLMKLSPQSKLDAFRGDEPESPI